MELSGFASSGNAPKGEADVMGQNPPPALQNAIRCGARSNAINAAIGYLRERLETVRPTTTPVA
jgi:hypothetical protein